ncbi:unnamed protein product [Owenia fusiformis]|uniref:Folliculin n=1 Tax=Owenia fusiformis TaxID=6347 RepID=A0A8S4PSG5_OWEFU|nr:unnamed protein product [Owenia fusiformis]
MNAIISLCHFCEKHGPSVLFCTQAFHSHDPHNDKEDVSSKEGQSYYSRCRRLKSPFQGTGDQTPTGDLTPGTPTSLPARFKSSDLCEACRSLLPGQPGFISNDHEAKVSYVSSQHPDHPEVFSLVRQACVRSLSCEVCPGREGPIFFGDDQRGHVLSHTFFIKDSQARGFQRWYSILVVMMDKVYLLNSWPFLVKHVRTVIDELQAKAAKVYDTEQAKCPQRAHRLNNLSLNATPLSFRLQRGANKAARSLIELINDKEVFKSLHLSFTWILKAGGNRMTERLLEGPPTEDSIIDLESQEETEEGFTLVVTKKVSTESVPPIEELQSLEISLPTSEPSFEDNKHEPQITNLRHLAKVLGGARMHVLAYHVVIGNQVIVRGKNKILVKSIITALKTLVPRGCCRTEPYSDTYLESWKCNFLGLSPDINIPNHIKNTEQYVMLDILEHSQDKDSDLRMLPGYDFNLTASSVLPEKVPTVLTKMELALSNENFTDSVVDECLTCLKEEWMKSVLCQQ